jgi:hypothetical protein
LQLARDAQSSGDIVVAENYLQHSEHYYRIIASAQAAQAQAQMGYGRPGEEVDEIDEDDDFVALPDRFASPFERNAPVGLPVPLGPNGQPIAPINGPMNVSQMAMGQPQPYLERPAFSNEFSDRPQNIGERQDRQERPDRQDRPERQDRPHRNDRRFNAQGGAPQGSAPQGGERVERDRNDQRGDRINQPNRNRFRDQPRFEPPPQPENREQPDVDFDATSALPAFITAPVRPLAQPVQAAPVGPPTGGSVDEAPAFAPPPAPVNEAPAAPIAANPPVADEGEDGIHLKPRRRRTRARAEEPTEEAGPAPTPESSSAE